MPLPAIFTRRDPPIGAAELIIHTEAKLALVQDLLDGHAQRRFEDLARRTLDLSRSFHGMAMNEGELTMLVPLMEQWIHYSTSAGRLTANSMLIKLEELTNRRAL